MTERKEGSVLEAENPGTTKEMEVNGNNTYTISSFPIPIVYEPVIATLSASQIPFRYSNGLHLLLK